MGGLDPSIDKDTLEKLFGIVPGFQRIEMDMDASNRFRVMQRDKLKYRVPLWLYIETVNRVNKRLPSLTDKV